MKYCSYLPASLVMSKHSCHKYEGIHNRMKDHQNQESLNGLMTYNTLSKCPECFHAFSFSSTKKDVMLLPSNYFQTCYIQTSCREWKLIAWFARNAVITWSSISSLERSPIAWNVHQIYCPPRKKYESISTSRAALLSFNRFMRHYLSSSYENNKNCWQIGICLLIETTENIDM